MRARPKASAQVLVEQLDGEGLLYDLRSHRAHALSPTAFAIFQQLDGQRDLDHIRQAAQAALGGVVSLDTVRETLRELEAHGLLEAPARRPGVSRRRALQAGVVLAAPVVFSIVAPSVAEAASTTSCVTVGACQKPGDCCGTPGGPAKTCNGGLQCGNNGNGSQCKGKVCG
jgi:hypothetical protein